MNDIKYVMLPRIEDKPKEIKTQPWYKERLREKYLKKSNSSEKILDPKQWIFIKDGLDDFRDGLPPPHEDLIIKPSKGPSPIVKNENWKYKESALSPSSRLNVNQRCYSKKLPLSQARRENIEKIISGLTAHPLALYPHLEEALPQELFEEILEILDPEINEQSEEILIERKNTSAGSNRSNQDDQIQPMRRSMREELQRLEDILRKEHEEARGEEEKKANVRNTYKWLLRKEELKAKAKGPDPEQLKAQAVDSHIKKVTEEYCNWVKSLGGEHNIDAVTLTSLFASGYETKPALSVPIHVVELTNIPAELRPNAIAPQINKEPEEEKNIYRDDENATKHPHYRYGAWYLPKEHWRFTKSNEKLADPKLIRDLDKKETIKKSEEINSRLAPLHGARAFKEYIKVKQPKRVPKLLDELDKWEKDQATKGSSPVNTISFSPNDTNNLKTILNDDNKEEK